MYRLSMRDFATIVREVVSSAYTDSRVALDVVAVGEALQDDLKKNGALLPTEEEVVALVMGDSRGEVPERLRVLYPRLNALIASEF